MLLSMTGYGGTKTVHDGITVVSEIKTVNNRYLKTSIRIPDDYNLLEPRIESLIREYLQRGTVNVSLRIIRETSESSHMIDGPALDRYLTDLKNLNDQRVQRGEAPLAYTLGDCLTLPGIVREKLSSQDDHFIEKVWLEVQNNLRESLQQLQKMRTREGEAMTANFRQNCDLLTELIELVEQLAPEVISSYRDRLTETVKRIMEEKKLPFSGADLVREVAIFTDKTDISEEIVRFRSHLNQFTSTIAEPQSDGKKLDFIVQEMFRETNTIGSKANSATITNLVVQIKGIIERIREMVQNVE